MGIKIITIKDNEKYLREISKPVILPDESLKDDIKLLEDYFKENDTTLALALNQIGILKRIIYLKNTNLDVVNRKIYNNETETDKIYNEHKILINPIITSRVGLTTFWEACASCNDYVGLVKRPYVIEVQYQDVFGEKHTETFKGFPATVLSHEIDHLDGILHMDIADEILTLTPHERNEFRKTYGYNIIYEQGDFNELKNSLKTLKKTI